MLRSIPFLALCGLCSVASAQFASVDWAGSANSVRAEFTDYALFNGTRSATADLYQVYDYSGALRPAGLPGLDAPDILSAGGLTRRFSEAGESWLETTGNWDLSVWSPALSGYETQLFTFQIAYFANEADSTWRQNYNIGVQLHYADGTAVGSLAGPVVRTSTLDTASALVTETFNFSVQGAADGVFIDIAADPALSASNPSYITGMRLDSVSFTAIPEPSTYAAIAGVAVFAAVVVRRRFATRS